MTETNTGQNPGDLLITGSTGMIGGLVVDALVERQVPFTAMVRPGSEAGRLSDLPGSRVLEADFDDPASLQRALQGVRRTFLVTNSSERTEAQQKAFVAAAQQAGVEHVVKLSQLHAAADSPVRFLRYHAAVEQAIQQAGLGHTFVRPNLIFQAYLAFAPMIAAGVLPAPIGDARISMVDARDIAAVSAASLLDGASGGRTYDVTGPEAVTHAEVAAAFAAVAGHSVEFQSVPAEDFAETLGQFGMPAWQAAGLVEDYAHYQRGEAAGISTDVERVTGRAPVALDQFAADHAAAFRG